MSDFALTWDLVRQRFVKELDGLSEEQLNWHLHPQALTIGQMAIHVAGVEVSFTSQLLGAHLGDFETRLRAAATDGVVNDLPFPFREHEVTPDLVKRAMDCALAMLKPIIDEASPEIRGREIKSALGPMISGDGAFARLAYHPSYHHGQAYLVKTAPGFPT